jgi:hypothetical protein
LTAFAEMVMALKHRSSTYKIILILVTTLSGLLFLTKDSYASNPTVVGFIIEASQMEGTLQNPVMIVGNTTVEEKKSMLELHFTNLSSQDLVIKKIVNTPSGIVTTSITSKEKINLDNVDVSVTNAEFSESYIPENGNIGFKNVKLLAHDIKTDHSSLPNFILEFYEGGQMELVPKSEDELLQLKAGLEQLLSVNTN